MLDNIKEALNEWLPKLKTKKGIATLLVVAILAGGGYYYIHNKNTNQGLTFKLADPKESKKDDNGNSTRNFKDSHERGKATLEKSDSPVDESKAEEAKKQIQNAYQALIESSTNEADYNKNYGITEQQAIEAVKQANNFEFKPNFDTLEVFKSDSSNVYQFVFDLTRESDGQTVTVTGNYVYTSQQVQFSTIQGDLNVAR